MERAEKADLLGGPPRLRRGRRAQHDQRLGVGQSRSHRLAQIRRSREFVPIAEDRQEPVRDSAPLRFATDEALGEAIRLEATVEPCRNRRVVVAVAEEGAVT
jgi:hypothetical protein